MSFYDDPIIDNSSRNSERSERRMKDFLNQDSGFICRTEIPDKGCDFDAELILAGTRSSSWKFAIQLKSIEDIKVVEEGKFISYSFSTSRIGYLMRRIPAMGIVVLYSLQHDKCYYEYVDKLYNRLMEERGTDDWMMNEKVNIHIPIENRLSDNSVVEIHQTFERRFTQAVKMQNSHGENYGLPAVNQSGEFQYDFNNIDHVKKFLSEYGFLLLANYDLGKVYAMVSKIPNVEISKNKELLLIAAVSFSERRLYADSELYCSKLVKFSLDQSESTMIEFVKLKNKLGLGYINDSVFLQALELLDREGEEDHSRIVLDINIIKYKLGQNRAFEEASPELESFINSVFDRIKNSDLSRRVAGILTLWNCENLAYYISGASAAKMGEFKIRESLGENISLEERKSSVEKLVKLNQLFDDHVIQSNNVAVQIDDKFLKAMSLTTQVRYFIHQHINYYSFDTPVDQLPNFRGRIANMISYAGTAFNYFNDLEMPQDAYDSACNMIELVELAELGYHIPSQYDKSQLYLVKQQMEEDIDIPSRVIEFPNLVGQKKQDTIIGSNMSHLKNLNDNQLRSLAKIALKGFGLPEDRLENIFKELKAYSLFHRRCRNSSIELLQIKNDYEQLNPYVLPIRFVLRNNPSSVESVPTDDIESLLASWGL